MIEALRQYAKGLTVLVVEDEAIARDGLKSLLDRFFERVETAADGEEGLRIYREGKGRIDLILSDISMPKMSGLEMSRKILESYGQAHIILVSAHSETENLLEAIELGVEYFLVKPIRHDRIFEVLARACDRIRKEKDLNRLQEESMRQKVADARRLTLESLLPGLPVPAVVVDEEDWIRMHNREFFQLFSGQDELEQRLRDEKLRFSDLISGEEEWKGRFLALGKEGGELGLCIQGEPRRFQAKLSGIGEEGGALYLVALRDG